MKKIITSLILILILSGVCSAQSGWFTVYSDSVGLETIVFTDVNTGYAGGFAMKNGLYKPRLLKTINAGLNWVRLITPVDTLSQCEFIELSFTDGNLGFVTSGGYGVSHVLRSTNGGTNWTVVLEQTSKFFCGIHFPNSNTGYMVGGLPPFVKKTTNSGVNWWDLSIPVTSGYLITMDFTDVNTGWVIGNHYQIIKTTNGGNNWITQTPYIPGLNLWGVSFSDANTGVAVGGRLDNTANIILRTTNGGNNWNTISYSDTTCRYLDVYSITSSSTVFIIGICGQILKSTNSGLNWGTQLSPANYANWGCIFTNVNTGYIAGFISPSLELGYILKTTDGGGNFVRIAPITNEIPDRFMLYQNYPNPFNPVTKITFALSKSGDVKLISYDVMGREIAVLVNEKLSHGTYEVDFDGTNYPSGVYFYRLTADDFTDVKKMILLK